MREFPDYQDLILGSSTSEAFNPNYFEQKYKTKVFQASTGGAGMALRYLFLKNALASNPHLKRVIYVADLFEFKKLDLPSEIYYQKDFQEMADPKEWALVKGPDRLQRVSDFLSHQTFEKSIKTAKELIRLRKGSYQSEFKADGSTKKSLLLESQGEKIESRVARSVSEYEPLYRSMKILDPDAIALLNQIAYLAKQHPAVELVFVLAPLHPDFVKSFEKELLETGLYQDWKKALFSIAGENIRVIDFSFPTYQTYGVGSDVSFWSDGVHFGERTMKIIAGQIY
jgi:hypothetical protein